MSLIRPRANPVCSRRRGGLGRQGLPNVARLLASPPGETALQQHHFHGPEIQETEERRRPAGQGRLLPGPSPGRFLVCVHIEARRPLEVSRAEGPQSSHRSPLGSPSATGSGPRPAILSCWSRGAQGAVCLTLPDAPLCRQGWELRNRRLKGEETHVPEPTALGGDRGSAPRLQTRTVA